MVMNNNCKHRPNLLFLINITKQVKNKVCHHDNILVLRNQQSEKKFIWEKKNCSNDVLKLQDNWWLTLSYQYLDEQILILGQALQGLCSHIIRNPLSFTISCNKKNSLAKPQIQPLTFSACDWWMHNQKGVDPYKFQRGGGRCFTEWEGMAVECVKNISKI